MKQLFVLVLAVVSFSAYGAGIDCTSTSQGQPTQKTRMSIPSGGNHDDIVSTPLTASPMVMFGIRADGDLSSAVFIYQSNTDFLMFAGDIRNAPLEFVNNNIKFSCSLN